MSRSMPVLFGAALLIIGATAAFLWRAQGNRQLGEPGVNVVAADSVSGWKVVLPAVVLDYTSEELAPYPEEINGMPKDTTYGRRRYTGPDGFNLVASVVLMGTDRTSIHRPEFCLTGQGWKLDRNATGFERVPLPAGFGRPDLELSRILVDKSLVLPDGRQLPARGVYLYWFVADNRLTAHQGDRLWSMARQLLLTGELERWAYVSCFAVAAPGQEDQVRERMRAFITAAAPAILRQPGGTTSPK